MPNVGKSSFVNKILNKKLSIVTNIAGTTRDSVDSFFKYYNKTIRLIDTAGLRKKSKIHEEIEFYSLIRTERALDEADIAIVMIDASLGFRKQDRDIVRMVHAVNSGHPGGSISINYSLPHNIYFYIQKYKSAEGFIRIFICLWGKK